MSPVGHGIFGATVALAAVPRGASRRTAFGTMAICAAAALVPDYRISGWGHYRYDVSHSLLVNLVLVVPLALGVYLTGPLRRLVERRGLKGMIGTMPTTTRRQSLPRRRIHNDP